MKVCIVSPHTPSDDAIGHYSAQIADELCKKAEVVVLANKGSNLSTLLRGTLKEGDRHYTVLRIWRPGVFYPFTIFRGIVQQTPDIVHIQHEFFLYGKGVMGVLFPIILVLTKLTRIPLVVTMHHVIPKDKADISRQILGAWIPKALIKAFLTFFNSLFSISSRIIVPATNFKNTLSRDYKISNRKIEVVPHFASPNCTNVSEKFKLCAKSRLHLSGKKVALFFGYIRPSKGIEYVLHSMPDVIKDYPNMVFSVVGHAQPQYSDYLDYIRRLVKELELSRYTRFEKYVPEELLPIFFAAADVVVFPYTLKYVNTPIAYLRAATFGKPIIATNIDCFTKEFIDHENAILIPPRDPHTLGKSIIEVFTDHALSKKLSYNITRFCSQRSREIAVKRIIEIYHDVLAQK